MTITNSHGAPVTISRVYSTWVKAPQSQQLARLRLNSLEIWDRSDPDTPSDIPAEGAFIAGADHTIQAAAAVPFEVQFLDDLQPGNYSVHIVFDIGCQVSGTFP